MPFFKITLKNSKIKKFPQIRSPLDCLNRNEKTFANGDPMVISGAKAFHSEFRKIDIPSKIQAAIDWFCRLKASASNS